ncbi:TIR domain-containing protein [Methylomagnum ishizawai]|uniref:TIR domain-containing protein n=1 Tax=Methylomagnum ishizawai TaxID=1760988 RepID=A0A1Y6D0A1_9GAMM|nr:toll/interleukin-1 receptor domain-containing protein [Methylomagnum ishizawai]SMF96369.1 TIR domain-containing protein [Methylomagnum ishizawai]
MPSLLSEKEWRDLLVDVDAGTVIPVIGPALITLHDPNKGEHESLYSMLAPKLAAELELPQPERFTTTAQVAATHVLSGRGCSRVYRELRALLRTVDSNIGVSSLEAIAPTLQLLARIRSFSLFIGTTPDHHMAHALGAHRPGFDLSRHLIVFHPNESPEERDLPTTRLRGPEAYLYQLLGDQDAHHCRDFAVWEEDLMEFICGLLEHSDQLKNLFTVLRERSLLFLGAPADDWTVRFLLRVVRGERLSNRRRDQISEYIADDSATLSQSTMLYFDQAVQTTRLIGGNPAEFTYELFSRWQQSYGVETDDRRFLDSLPAEMPSGAVFISYANEDLPTALDIARALHSEGVPIWIDRRHLQAGQRYDEKLEAAVKLRSSLFIALVSPASESSPTRYVQNERRWAAMRQGDLSDEFYLPVLHGLPSPEAVRVEPENVRKKLSGKKEFM